MGQAKSLLPNDLVLTKDEIMELFRDSGIDGQTMYRQLRTDSGHVRYVDLCDICENLTDCFCTHDWGNDEKDRNNHERVKRLNSLSKNYGLTTWFDEERMTGDVRDKMGEGIDTTRVVVVFITYRYIDKVAGKGTLGDRDNCRYEFVYSVDRKGPSKFVPVVTEQRASDPSTWIGPVARSLGTTLYIAFWDDDTDERFEECTKRIVEEIMNRIQQKPIKQLLRERLEPLVLRKTSTTPGLPLQIDPGILTGGASLQSLSISSPVAASSASKHQEMETRWEHWLIERNVVPADATKYAKSFMAKKMTSV